MVDKNKAVVTQKVGGAVSLGFPPKRPHRQRLAHTSLLVRHLGA